MAGNPFINSAERRAISYENRSPFSFRPMIGVPPRNVNSERVESNGGVVSVGGVPLPQLDERAPQGSQPDMTPIPGETPIRPMPGYSPQYYGDAIVFAVVFAGAGEQLVLQRPNNIRTSLLIVNSTVAGLIFYTFDRVADNISCVPIIAQGNRLFDFSVPQGDLHIFSSGAGIVIIEYMNRDIRQESYR